MKKSKGLAIVLVMVTTSLIVSQCTLPERHIDGYSANIGNPTRGAVIGVGETVEISGYIIDHLDDIDSTRENHIIFYINGLQVGEEDVTLGPNYYINTEPVESEWIPEEPGEYFLQVSSFRRPHWSISTPTKVCVIDFSMTTTEWRDYPSYWGTYGYEGECEIPERSPDAVPGTITFDVTASPDPLSYFPGWWSDPGEYYYMVEGEPLPEGCDDIPSAITFRATASDPNDDIVMVKVDVSYEWITSYRYVSLILTRESGSGLTPKIFSGDAFTQHYGNPSEINKTFEVVWTAYAFNRSGDIVATDGPHTIPVNPCYDAVMVPLSAPLPSEIPQLPAPEQLCPEGTYYVPLLKQCVAIQLFDTEGFKGIDVSGPENGDSGDQGENGCNLSIEICSYQGYSFDSNNCQCILLP